MGLQRGKKASIWGVKRAHKGEDALVTGPVSPFFCENKGVGNFQKPCGRVDKQPIRGRKYPNRESNRGNAIPRVTPGYLSGNSQVTPG